MYEEFASIIKPAGRDTQGIHTPSNSRQLPVKDVTRSKSTPSLKKAWRKWLGLHVAEPDFEIVTSESKISLVPDEKIINSPAESVGHEASVISRVPLSRPHSALSSVDGTSSEGTLVDGETPRIVRVFVRRLGRVRVLIDVPPDHHYRRTFLRAV